MYSVCINVTRHRLDAVTLLSQVSGCDILCENLHSCHCSIIGNEDDPDVYELHICAKDFCIVREDHLVVKTTKSKSGITMSKLAGS